MKKYGIPAVLALAIFLMTGCSGKTRREQAEVRTNEYEKITYETVDACRGDIAPTLSLKLEADSFERVTYFPSQDEMEIEQVYVKKGDMVHEGDVLISFKSGDIEEQIAQYEDKCYELKLLIEHYTYLSQIDSSLDYSKDIALLNEDIEVANLYMAELNARLDSYSIKAERTGMILNVSDIVSYGTVNSTDSIISVIYGTGDYFVSTTDDYNFEIGMHYTAGYGVLEYDMELVSIEDEGEDVNGNMVRKLKFHMVSEDGRISELENLNMVIEKPVLKDVIYVPKEALVKVDEIYYVYLLDENGFRHAAEVDVVSTVDGVTVIRDGICENDKVVIR